jgi:hypothetical protein
MVEHPLPAVEACAVLHLRPRMFQLVEVRADETMFEAFLHLIQVYRWMQDVAVSSPVGEMVTPVNLVVPDPDPRLVEAPSLEELLEAAPV